MEGSRWEVGGGRWEGSGKVRHRKELFSFHLACAFFPTVIFKLHGVSIGFVLVRKCKGTYIFRKSTQFAIKMTRFVDYLVTNG